MGKHRTCRFEIERQAAQEYLAGETLHGLARRYDLSRTLIRIWVNKYEASAFHEEAKARDLLQQREAKIDALERLFGKQALELEFPKGGSRKTHAGREARESVVSNPTHGLFAAHGCTLIGLPRSGECDAPAATTDETGLVARVKAICDEFEAYG